MKAMVCMVMSCSFAITAAAQQVTVTPLKMNVAYIGVANPLLAVAEKYPCRSLLLRTGNGRLEKLEGCRYDYYPERPGKTEITVYRLQGRDTVQLGTIPFRCKLLPVPAGYLAGKTSGKIPVAVLRAQSGLSANIEGFDMQIRYTVRQYRMTLVKRSGPCTTLLTTDGPLFSAGMKALLATAGAGDTLLFFGIVADGPQQRDMQLLPLEFTVD